MILRGCPKKWLKKSQSKCALWPHFPIDVTWERGILLSLSRNNQKDIFHAQGVLATGVWTCGAPWHQHYPVSNVFFGTPRILPNAQQTQKWSTFARLADKTTTEKLKYIPHKSNMSPNCKQDVQYRKSINNFWFKKMRPSQISEVRCNIMH